MAEAELQLIGGERRAGSSSDSHDVIDLSLIHI